MGSPTIRTMTAFIDGFSIEYTTDSDNKTNGLTATHVLFIPNDDYAGQIGDIMNLAGGLLEEALDDFASAQNIEDFLRTREDVVDE